MSAINVRPRARVEAMPEYHPPLGKRDGIRLDFNENTTACSPRVAEAIRAMTTEGLTRYPERAPVEAKAAAAVGLASEQVVLTNGVDEAIHVLCQAFLEEGDELLLPVPTYSMYEIYAAQTDARLVSVQAGEDFAFPLGRILATISPKTKLICIATPNSPTGAVVSREQILAVCAAAPEALVLVDEAYFHFHGETVISLVGQVPNLAVARTFSKAYGLAGLRLGLLACSVENMRWVRRVLSPYSVNSVALAALTAALDDQAYLDCYVAEVKRARMEFLLDLTGLNLRTWPTEANFVLVEIGEDHRGFVSHMREAGILVRDRSADPGCDGLVRITIGTREQMRRASAAIEKYLAARNSAAKQMGVGA